MELIGLGLYTFKEVSKLTGISVQDLHRWLRGYTRKSKSNKQEKYIAPLWETQFNDLDIEAVSFHDLLEVRFVRAFRKHGVSLQAIRIASDNARMEFDHKYPFTCKRFQTDGRTIFAEALKETGETQLLDLVKRQFAFSEVIQNSLYKGIEFDQDNFALKWHPLKNSKQIVLDPQFSFGKPIVTNGSIRTSTLYDAYLAEESEQLVSKLYEVPVSAVKAAIRFEEQLAA